VDDGSIHTGPNYGLGLHRREDGALYAVTGPKAGGTYGQYLLTDNGKAKVGGARTNWRIEIGRTEGMVGDDETGYLYLGEEDVGIWRVRAMDSSDRTLIAEVGDASGLTADVEGVTLYYAPDGDGYLIASSQGANKFTVLQRRAPHLPVGEFTVAGVGQTDGIDVLNVGLGPLFPHGIFTFHNGIDCCPVQAARWDDVAQELGGLIVDTGYWNPRRTCGPVLSMIADGLIWTAVAPALAFDVGRGDLVALRASRGDFSKSPVTCLGDNLEVTALADDALPAPGSGYWYLVRGEASFGALTYDSYSATQVASRDAGINAAPGACP
jgi:hypothetical protein